MPYEYEHFPWLMLVLAAVATLLLLVSVWAGAAERPAWYWRTAVLFAVLAALFPIEAYEPAALFLLVMPATALGVFLIWQWKRREVSNEVKACELSRGLKFSLRDLLLSMVFVGVISAMFAVLWRDGAFTNWFSLLVEAAGLIAITVSLAALMARPDNWITWLAFVASSVLSCVPISLDETLGVKDYYYNGGIDNMHANYWHFLLLVCISIQLLVLILLRTATGSASLNKSNRSRRVFWAACGALVVLGVVVLGPLAYIYFELLVRTPLPLGSFATENSLPRVLDLGSKAGTFASPNVAIVEAESPPDVARAEQLRLLFSEMRVALEQEGHVVLTLTSNERADFNVHVGKDDGIMLRGLARQWRAEAKQAAAAGNHERAVEYSLASVRLGNSHAHGGLLIDSLYGIVVEESGIAELAEVRHALPPLLVRSTIDALIRVDGSREASELTLARELAFGDRTFTWRRRLSRALYHMRGRQEESASGEAISKALQRREAYLRLLMIELALQLFQNREQRLPTTLAELVPQDLPVVQMDPFSGESFVYRLEGEKYALYSVGYDGVDNDGKPLSKPANWTQLGFDLDIDALQRMATAGSGS